MFDFRKPQKIVSSDRALGRYIDFGESVLRRPLFVIVPAKLRDDRLGNASHSVKLHLPHVSGFEILCKVHGGKVSIFEPFGQVRK